MGKVAEKLRTYRKDWESMPWAKGLFDFIIDIQRLVFVNIEQNNSNVGPNNEVEDLLHTFS